MVCRSSSWHPRPDYPHLWVSTCSAHPVPLHLLQRTGSWYLPPMYLLPVPPQSGHFTKPLGRNTNLNPSHIMQVLQVAKIPLSAIFPLPPQYPQGLLANLAIFTPPYHPSVLVVHACISVWLGAILRGFAGDCRWEPVLEAKPDINLCPSEPHFGHAAGLSASVMGRIKSNSVWHLAHRYSYIAIS